jgi:hypothetical protein
MRKCVVTFNGYSLELESESLYRAVIAFHTHAACGFADAIGYPVPGMDDHVYVETDGPDGRVIYRVRYGDTRPWANREAERVNGR